MAKLAKRTVKQLLRLLSLLLAVCIFSFWLMERSPVDPVQAYVGAGAAVSPEQRESISRQWGLGESPARRFGSWAGSVLRGDLGDSLLYRRPVARVIGEKFTASLALMACAWVLSGVIGLLLGILMGLYRGGLLDRILKTICLVLSSTPAFWVGMVLLAVFAVELGWFPVGLRVPPGIVESEATLLQRLHHLALPALTLTIASFGGVALQVREKMAAVMDSDYILFARARGETKGQMVRRHALRAVAVPAVTMQFALFGELFGGSVLAEQVFSYPGLGQAAVQAGLGGDVPLLLGVALCGAVFVFTGNFLADLLHSLLDPRVREGEA